MLSLSHACDYMDTVYHMIEFQSKNLYFYQLASKSSLSSNGAAMLFQAVNPLVLLFEHYLELS